MFNFWKNTISDDFDSLEKELLSLQKVELPSELKQIMRQELMQHIENRQEQEFLPLSLRHLVQNIRRKSGEVSIPAWAAVMLKERILDYIELSGQWHQQRFFEKGGMNWRTAVAGVLLFVFAATAVFIVPFRAPTAYAKETYLQDVTGEVLVVRRDAILKAKSMMSLQEGDKVVTKESGGATIHFFDDSISRLAEETSVNMKRLHAEPLNVVVTSVEMELEEGHMWTRVVNLRERSSFLVDTSSASADVQKKAAFDLASHFDTTEIAVYDNVVEVSAKKSGQGKSKVVIAGYKAAVSDSSLDVTVEKIDGKGDDAVWVAANLSSDETYKEELIVGREEMFETQGEKTVLMTSSLNVPDETVDAARQKVHEAYKTLVNAEAQLVRGAREQGMEGLQDFKNQIAFILSDLVSLEESDPLYAQLLRDLMREKIAMQLKDFASFKPGNRLYRAKEVLQETELALASSDVERVEVQLTQAEDALLEMQELLGEGKPNLAATLLKRYQKRTNNFSLGLSEKNRQELDEKFVSLIQQQANHMKVLTAIEKSIVYRDQFEFRDQVRKVRDDTLRKFLMALEQNPDQVPEDILLSVKDLYDSYVVGDNSSIADLIDPAVEKLLAKEYQVSFISPDNNPSGLAAEGGVLVLVAREATADVGSGDWVAGSHTAGREESED